MKPGELVSDYRDRLAIERAEADERRRTALLDLTSIANSPAARIHAWERAHKLAMPRAASHRVLQSIAAATHLTLEQVQEEQRRRLSPAPQSSPMPDA